MLLLETLSLCLLLDLPDQVFSYLIKKGARSLGFLLEMPTLTVFRHRVAVFIVILFFHFHLCFCGML